jgi:hypothetical protein
MTARSVPSFKSFAPQSGTGEYCRYVDYARLDAILILAVLIFRI